MFFFQYSEPTFSTVWKMDPQDKSQAKMKWPLEATDVNDKKGRMEQKLQQTAWRCIFLREPFLTDGDIYIYIYILSSRDVSDVHGLSAAFTHSEYRAA